MNEELLELLEDLCRHHVHTNKADGKTVGCVSAESEALEALAKAGRFRVVRRYGRTVTGYWPENEPKEEPK